MPIDAIRSAYKKPWGRLVFVGLFLGAGFGVPLCARIAKTTSPSRVQACSIQMSHGPNARLVLESGKSVLLGTADLAYPEHCLRVGTLVEKRRGELTYRINGSPAVVGTPDIVAACAGSLAGVVLIVSGLGWAWAASRHAR